MNSSRDIVNLVVVAHPDDEVLGFGATGAKLVQQGEKVQVVILCGAAQARTQRPEDQQLRKDLERANSILGFQPPVLGDFPNIRMNNVDHIDLVQFIEKNIIEYQPHRIFTHHPADLNDDHLQVSKACLAASRLWQRRDDVQRLMCLGLMEILSSSDWSYAGVGSPFLPNQFVEIEKQMDLKLQALSAYKNVMRPFPHPRSEEILTGLAAYRGGQSGLRYAEAFQIVHRLEL